jgi:hypothetical protein
MNRVLTSPAAPLEERPMTLRDTICAAIVQHITPQRPGEMLSEPWGTPEAADAILAAIRTHMTSPEAVERARVALHRVRWARGTALVNGTFKVSDQSMGEDAEAAILAALGGEP